MSYYDQQDDDLRERPQRELTLSTLTILGLFFGFALICAACFGLGYNMGSRSRQTQSPDAAAANSANFNSFKPSASAPAIQPVPGYLSPKDAAAANASAANSAYNPPAAVNSSAPSTASPPPVSHEATAIVRDTVKPAPATPPTGAPAPVATPVLPPAAQGAVMVQVAAVSHKEDADLLVSALKQKGYPVASHTEPGDHYFHIQIGPFPSKAAAEPTRQRLLADGYNALIK
jgi:cell division septation protein DedD